MRPPDEEPGLKRSRLLTAALPFVTLGLGLLCTLWLWRTVTGLEEDVARGRIEQEAHQRVLALEQQLHSVERTLTSVVSLFRSSSEVTQDEFGAFVSAILESNPDIRCIGFNPAIPRSHREDHEAEAQQRGFPNYLIRERASNEELIPARSREIYFPAYFIEPLEGNRAAHGFDVGSEPRRLAALTRARDQQRFSITAPIHLVQDADNGSSVLGFIPHFSGGDGFPQIFEGYIVGVYSISHLVENGLASFREGVLTSEIQDTTDTNSSELLWRTGDMEYEEGLDYQHTLQFGGRQWSVRFRPTAIFRDSMRDSLPLATLAAGILISLLLALVMALLVRHGNRVEHLLRIYREELVQRQQFEERLEKSKEHLTLTLSAISDGAWDWDIESGRVTFTPSWLESLGYEPGQLGETIEAWNDLLHPDDLDRVLRSRERHLSGATAIFENENRLRTQRGVYRQNLSRGKVVQRDEHGAPLRMVGVDADISLRKQEEAEKSALLRKVQQSQKLESLGVVVGGIAHDFNNLLVGILGSTELARETVESGSPLQEHLTRIEKAGERASELTKEMLAYAGRGSFAVEDVDLSRLTDEMPQLLSASLSKKATIEKQLCEAGVWVHADSAQLRQILMNLLINASDSLEDRSGTITLRSGVEEVDRNYLSGCLLGQDCPAGRYAFIEVQDTGDGMSPEVAERVFDPFFTTKETGRGLGLAAVIGIVRWHSGAIHLTSAPGRGTTIRILIPAIVSNRPGAGENAPRAHSTGWRSSGTALVCDDEDAVRQIMVTVLRRCGFDILEACDGQECLARFEEHGARIDVAVLDMSMPHVDGIEAASAMRRVRPDLPIVITSGYAENDDLLSIPGACFVAKPFPVADLIAAVRQVLETKLPTS